MKSFGDEPTVYEDVDVLEPDTETYKPSELPERKAELTKLHSVLRPVTMDGTPRNVLVYGPTGQGKTVGVTLKTEQLLDWADEADVDLTAVQVGCKGCNNSYNVLALLVKELREIRMGQGVDKPSGYTRKTLLEMTLEELEEIGGTVVIILDEIDAIGEDDYVLYELPRADLDDVRLGIIGITNDLQFRNNLDADVRSSLGEREIVFKPYDAPQLQNILARRAVKALRDTRFADGGRDYEHLESEVLADGTIPLCASLAAQETGDARQAIQLLSYACDLATDEGSDVVTEQHVRAAKDEIEEEAIAQSISSETTQRKLALLSAAQAALDDDTPAETGDLYRRYSSFCTIIDVNELVEHTYREKLNDLVDWNILTKSRHGRGRGEGMSNRYELAVTPDLILNNLADDTRVGDLVERIRG